MDAVKDVPKTPTGDEDDDFFEEPIVEAIMGGVQSAGGTDELSAALLGLCGEVTKVGIALAELDEDEFCSIAARLAALRILTHNLPTHGTPRRKMGFKPPTKAEPVKAEPAKKPKGGRRKRGAK